MSERWQRELSKLHGSRLGDDLWDRVVTGPRLEPPPVDRRRHIAVVITAFAAVIAAGAVLWSVFAPLERAPAPLRGSDVVEVPPRGEVSAIFLPDGRPVFVVHHEDGDVSVVDSFSPHRAWGFEELVVWCPSTRQFIERAHEAHFDEFGSWHSAGPSPSGLATFAFDVLARDAAGDASRIKIGAMRDPDPGGSPPITEPTRPPFCPEVDGRSSETVAHTVDGSSVYTPAAAVRARPDGWFAVRGTLLVGSDGFVQLCANVDGDACGGGAIVRGIDGVGLLVNVLLNVEGPSGYEEPRVWLARLDGTVLDDLAIGDVRAR
jgi:hypothetical protein